MPSIGEILTLNKDVAGNNIVGEYAQLTFNMFVSWRQLLGTEHLALCN